MAKKAKAPKKGKEQKLPEFSERIELRHNFSETERAEFGKQLSHKLEEKQLLTEQMKSSAKSWKSKIDAVQVDINALSQKGRDGYEMRPTECRVVFDRKLGKKHIYRKVDGKPEGEFVETRDMTQVEFERLPLPEPEPKKPAPKPDEGLTSVGDAVEKAEKEKESGDSEEGGAD